jgi:hypothetical protein
MDVTGVGQYALMTYDFLVASGVLYILIGAGFTALISRFAVIPTLKKIRAIVDVVIEKGEDGKITPEEALEIMKVIEEQIDSDIWEKIFGWIFGRPTVNIEELKHE